MRILVTFGQEHAHRVNGYTFDKDSVAVITANSEKEAREIAFELFGPKFFTTYSEAEFDQSGDIRYYPRGKQNAN